MKDFLLKLSFFIFLGFLGYFVYQVISIEREKFILKEKERKEKSYYLEKNLPKKEWSSPKSSEIKSPPKENYLLKTKIISGPKENEVLKDTIFVKFEFEGKIISKKQIKKTIHFETKLEPQEKEWQKTYLNWRKIKLDPKIKKFKFLVRARTDKVIDKTPAQRIFFLDTSCYFDKIKIENVWRWSDVPVIVLRTKNLEKDEKINFTGLKIKGKKFQKEIKKATRIWKQGAKEEDVIAKNYQKIYLIGEKSPLGKSFLLNKCMGYLKENFQFFPNFYTRCPKPKIEEISHLSETCQEFILNLRNCEIPNWQKNYEISRDSKCVDYLQSHFNYSSCLKNHQKDKDFFEDAWYLYLGEFSLNKLHNKIELFDKNNKFISRYIY